MNKYLEKIASNVGYNINYNIEDDPYYRDMLSRQDVVDNGNWILFDYGFKPSLTMQPKDYITAMDLENRDFEAGLRPRELDSNKKAVVGGLAAGGLAGGIAGAALKSGLAGVGVGVPTSLIVGKIIKKLSYNDTKREEDNIDVGLKTNRFYDYLSKRYEKDNEQ